MRPMDSTEWRKKHEVEKVKETSPALAEWLDMLPEGHKKRGLTRSYRPPHQILTAAIAIT